MISSLKNAVKYLSLLLVVCIVGVSFSYQYMKLSRTIEEERTSYISEIRDELLEKIELARQLNSGLVSIYTKIIEDTKPESFQELKKIFRTEYTGMIENSQESYWVVDKNGIVYNLDKQKCAFSNDTLIKTLIIDHVDFFSYTQSDFSDEYWIYADSIKLIEIEGIQVVAIVKGILLENMKDQLTVELFDNLGSTYIVDKDGNVIISSGSRNELGFNLIQSLKEKGVQQKVIDQLTYDFYYGVEGWSFVEYDDIRWLVDYSSKTYYDWKFVILIPMTVTGANTYTILAHTMILAVLFIVAIFSLVLTFIVSIMKKVRDREKTTLNDRYQAQLEMRAAKTKSDFFAQMYHDIRTPLNAIICMVQFAKEEMEDKKKAISDLENAESSAKYLMGILNDILEVAKIDNGKMRLICDPFDMYSLIDVIEKMMKSIANQKHIRFQVIGKSEIQYSYLGDELRLKQILTNLLSNAVKFTEEGGKVTLKIKRNCLTETTDEMHFTVEDTGNGIAEEFLNRIFLPYQQETKEISVQYGGSGLGLSIANNLVELMGGTISVLSTKGVGSSFTVKIPFQRTELRKKEEILYIPEEKLQEIRGKRVLLVEDNEMNVLVSQKILMDRLGMKVDIAENGKVAVDMFQKSLSGTYSMILMDIRMPVMDGIDATKHIRALHHADAFTIPILAMSANAMEEDIKNAICCGMNAYLTKPINIDSLKSALCQYVIEK